MSNTNALSPQWVSYLTVQDDLKPWLQFPAATGGQDVVLEALLEMACTWVQNFLGRPVAPTEFERRFNGASGWNGAYIMLPFAPVLEVKSVTEFWASSGPHVLQEQTPDNQVDGYQVDYGRGMLIRAFTGLVQKPWFPGSRNVEVTWVAGYNPIPADLKIATLELANHWYRNTQEATRTFRVQSEYDSPSASGLWPAIPNRIKSLLEPYGQVGIG